MKIIVVGMGRMGLGLASRLEEKGHEVIAIDQEAASLEDLDSSFAGRRLLGSAMDQATLEDADIDRVDALVACTNSDEVNAVVARLAKNVYQVPKVIARIYDPEKAEVYRHLGIEAISALDWAIDRTMEMVSHDHIDGVYTMGDGSVTLVRVNVPPLMAGETVDSINMPGGIRVVAIVRAKETIIPISGAQLEVDDVVYIAVEDFASEQLKHIFGK